jgi:DNA mismatch repair ATPase MutS
MGGKTVTLKMIGILVWLSQMGLFVPAEKMSLSLRGFIFVSIGDEQDVDLGLSTFGAEIIKVTKAVELSEKTGLVLIDELARGTNPKEGYAISKALISRLKTKSSMTVITTHFDGLADDDDVKHLQVCGLQGVDFTKLKDEIDNPSIGMDILHEHMDYRLKEIHSPEEVPKDAVRIAKLMGLDADILEDARSILNELGR